MIVTEQDILSNRKLPNACVPAFWPIDLHVPHPRNTKQFPGEEFIAWADHTNRGNHRSWSRIAVCTPVTSKTCL